MLTIDKVKRFTESLKEEGVDIVGLIGKFKDEISMKKKDIQEQNKEIDRLCNIIREQRWAFEDIIDINENERGTKAQRKMALIAAEALGAEKEKEDNTLK